MNKSFTFLHGTNLRESKSNYMQLFKQLLSTAARYKYELPTLITQQHEDSFFSKWHYEIVKPESSFKNSFFLVVIAPDCPGCSPINPFHKIDNHPMFAVNVCMDHFITWQEGDSNRGIKNKFITCTNFQEIQDAFEIFLSAIDNS